MNQTHGARILSYTEKIVELRKWLDTQKDDDFPLGKDTYRREAIVKMAKEAVDEIVMEGSEGSAEETNYLTAKVAAELMGEALQPLTYAMLSKDLADRAKKKVLLWEQIDFQR